MAQRALHGEVPLLGARCYEFSGNNQSENQLGRNHAGTRAAADVVGSLSGVSPRKTLQHAQARDKIWIKRAGNGQGVGIGIEATGQRRRREVGSKATRLATAKSDGK